ncbi:MAG: YjbQ family protein [Candidatus Heimdallarchaeota archaeon]|nr:YjbQ family protein [Candidatus Heimdallarchaeota archaeon]
MQETEFKTKYISVKTLNAGEYYDVTDELSTFVKESGIQKGILIAYSLHTTTGLVVNEGSDPGVGKDVSQVLWELIPETRQWNHTEESPLDSAAHVKAQMIGNSIILGIDQSRLILGTWQRVYFIEYIEARERKVFVIIFGK